MATAVAPVLNPFDVARTGLICCLALAGTAQLASSGKAVPWAIRMRTTVSDRAVTRTAVWPLLASTPFGSAAIPAAEAACAAVAPKIAKRTRIIRWTVARFRAAATEGMVDALGLEPRTR